MPVYFPKIITRNPSNKIVTWADGTPAEIAAMLAAHDAGDINIYDYWSVGDERVVSLGAITANPNGAFITSMAAQNITLVLMNEGYMNQSGVHYVVGQKDGLTEYGRYVADGGQTESWKNSLIRAALNSDYYNALDSDFRGLLKEFSVITGEYDEQSIQTVTDKVALFACKEVLNEGGYGAAIEASALTQIEYYQTTANRVKVDKKYNTDNGWMTRTPSGDWYINLITTSGAADITSIGNEIPIAPFMCI